MTVVIIIIIMILIMIKVWKIRSPGSLRRVDFESRRSDIHNNHIYIKDSSRSLCVVTQCGDVVGYQRIGGPSSVW